VEAIYEATIQVLLSEGAERLTTTRVAERAGVSVGTLYQYYPNKQSLLFAVLKGHMNKVSEAVEAACERARGKPMAEVVQDVVEAFVDAKMERTDISTALYRIAAEVDGPTLVRRAVQPIIEGAGRSPEDGAGRCVGPREICDPDAVWRNGGNDEIRAGGGGFTGDGPGPAASPGAALPVVCSGRSSSSHSAMTSAHEEAGHGRSR
jgi:hypothetical protein